MHALLTDWKRHAISQLDPTVRLAYVHHAFAGRLLALQVGGADREQRGIEQRVIDCGQIGDERPGLLPAIVPCLPATGARRIFPSRHALSR